LNQRNPRRPRLHDDWSTVVRNDHRSLNDILLWNPVESAFEVSSMGIRADKVALARRLEVRGCPSVSPAVSPPALGRPAAPGIGGGIGDPRGVHVYAAQSPR
jgi:aspartate--ammonia ligase